MEYGINDAGNVEYSISQNDDGYSIEFYDIETEELIGISSESDLHDAIEVAKKYKKSI